MPGLELHVDRQLQTIERELVPLIGELRSRDSFELSNPMYGPMDAHMLYAMLRTHRPSRVLELGSGYSTVVIGQALAANGDGARHEVVDPWPSELVTSTPGRPTVRAESAAAAPEKLFAALGESDVLFVDTSHSVRPGGEVVRLVLEVLPALKPGVIVHFHDFFRPFEYPRVLYDLFDVHWQEHYLLQAFLAYNSTFEVLFSNHALWRLRRERVKRLFPGLTEGREPSALWLRRL